MGKKNKAVDAYIAKSPEFARPILKKLRALFHKSGPQIEEEMKWNVPFFMHKGIVGVAAGFKNHVSWGIWKASMIDDPKGRLKKAIVSMGTAKITSVSELPADVLIVEVIKQAIALNDAGATRKKSKPKPPPKIPADFSTALKKNAKAAAQFKSFAPSKKRDYIDWIVDAKQPATRAKRIKQAVVWIAQGKSRNWKYM